MPNPLGLSGEPKKDDGGRFGYGLVINWTDGAMDIGAGWGSGGDRRGDRAERYRHEKSIILNPSVFV